MFLKTIPHFKDLVFIKENNEILLPLLDFVKFLKENRKPDDTPSRTDNIQRDFDKKRGIRKLGDKVYITLEILISYVISKTASIAICKDIYKDILKLIIAEKNYSDDLYTKKLYDDIAVFSSCNKHINAIEILEFNESQIVTLNSNYKHFFTDTEWKFICQFEYHFHQQYPDFADYSETLTRKFNFFAEIKKAYEIGSHLSKYTKEYTLRSQKRREFSDILYDDSFVVNETFHIYAALKSCIVNAVSGFFNNIEELVCVECSPESCAHVFKGVHIYIELSNLENTDEELRDLSLVICNTVTRIHGIRVPYVIFFKPGLFKDYQCKNCEPQNLHKFHMRDDFHLQKLVDKTVLVYRTTFDDIDPETVFETVTYGHESFCKICAHTVSQENLQFKPLDWRNFNLIQEWHLEVPLQLQTLLANLFINTDSIKRSENPQALTRAKLTRLYYLTDSALNLLNRNHSGIIQLLNTEDLIINYHSLSSVFGITSQAGASRSQKWAENWLQHQTDTDKLYYETYLKKYPLEYKTVNEENTAMRHVSMRDCIVIFYLDNLVRLRVHADPDPGLNRTSQICTLPMTLKGLPRDSYLTNLWHSIDCSEETCTCYDRISLEKEDHNLLFELTKTESEAKYLFEHQMYWGYLNNIKNSDEHFWKILSKQDALSSSEAIRSTDLDFNGVSALDDIDNLNNTLQSLSMYDLGEDSEYEQIESDGGDSLEENIDALDLESIELEEDFMDGIERLDLSVDDMIEETTTPSVDDMIEETTTPSVDDMIEETTTPSVDDMIEETTTPSVDDMIEETTTPSVDDMIEETTTPSVDDMIEETTTPSVDDMIEDRTTQFNAVKTTTPLDNMNENTNTPLKLHTSTYQHNDGNGDIERSQSEYNLISPVTKAHLQKFKVPDLLCRHPKPACGRDDDINNLKDILHDILIKLGRNGTNKYKDRILFAPDHKISKNLIALVQKDNLCSQFLPEFPILHLKKSKITNLFSAYKECGLMHLLKYMKDTEQDKDWMDLVTISNIETAAKNVKRIAIALHLSFTTSFFKTLSEDEKHQYINDMQHKDDKLLRHKWDTAFTEFIDKGLKQNGTFALHFDMMQHCDEIVGISIAERLGGPDGYNLMLACVKTSLPFAFLNGATSYASFCVDLLYCHYTAGVFHKCMKESLFSTPYKQSSVNFALDTQREMDHLDAKKGFRPRATIDSVLPRMSTVDRQNEVQNIRRLMKDTDLETSHLEKPCEDTTNLNEDHSKFDITEKELKFILPVAELVQRVGALSLEEDPYPRNVYESNKSILSESILDKESYQIGRFLVYKYACKQKLFKLDSDDIPAIESVKGSKPLLQRLKASKGVTMKRSTVKPTMAKTDKEKKEMKRKTLVKREHKITDCFSSEMNTCQALVKPDGTKASIQKSLGIKRALYKTLSYCFPFTDSSKIEDLIEKHGYIYRDVKDFPTEERHKIKYATVEFAGIKFKTKASTGDEYMQNINNVVINSLFNNKLFPNLQYIVICEEKYSFTPDDFKAATRQKRQKSMPFSISHLKIGDEIMSSEKLSKSAVLNTELGKRMITNYLARNISKLQIKRNLTLDVDSELVLNNCDCTSTDEGSCPHIRYTTPVRATFTNEGYQNTTLLKNIKQMKGEAEMSQVDWLSNIKDELKEGESVISIVTSADIDSIVIHLFALSIHWPRTTSGNFKNSVYVMLQKPKSEIFNITSIIEVLENRFMKGVGRNLAIACCIGGNDFIPKFHGFSHEKWITAILDENSINKLVTFDVSSDNAITGILDEKTFLDTVKRMYCPASVNANTATLEQVRQLSIKYPDKPFRPLVSWMPPKSALLQFIKLINCQIQYLLTAWKHDAPLPDFIGSGCLMKDAEGNIQYNFGSDIHIGTREDALTLPEDDIKILYSKKGKKKKRQRSANNTPTKEKEGKRKAVMSTPIKMKNKQDGAN